MTHVGYVAAGWAIPLGVLASYALWLRRRAKRLSDLVPPGERRWSGVDAVLKRDP